MATPETLLVVIPYCAKEAQGDELEFAIRGWLTHFKHPHRIVVVGDRHPYLDKFAPMYDRVYHIDCPRVDAGQFHPFENLIHLDHVHKFREVRKHFPDKTGFIYTCDDIYPVNDFGLGEVLLPKIAKPSIEGDATSPNAWKRDAARTREVCIAHGFDTREWVCHLPVYYEWDKLFDIYDLFDCDNRSYIVEDLYFNRYYKGRKPLLLDADGKPFSTRITAPETGEKRLKDILRESIWVNNNPTGWSRELGTALRRHYDKFNK